MKLLLGRARNWLKGHAPSFLWLAFAIGAKHFGFLQTPDGANMDWWLKLRSEANQEGLARVAAVLVDDSDYAQAFKGQSPLKLEPLADLIKLVQEGAPAVIAVDFDTADESFRALPDLLKDKMAGKAPIIWARAGKDDPQTVSALRNLAGTIPRRQRPDPVLGLPEPAIGTGALGLFALERDGVVRRYFRTLPTRGGGSMPSLGFAAVLAYCDSAAGSGVGACRDLLACGQLDCEDPVLVKYAAAPAAPRRIAAGDLRRLGQGGGWDAKVLFEKRVVIIGGSYRAARDAYAIPVEDDPVPGAVVWAHIVAAELGTQVVRQLSPLWVGLLEVSFLWAMIEALSQAKESKWSGNSQLAGLLFCVLAFSFLMSLVVYGNMLAFGSFLITVMGVFLDPFLERARDYRENAKALLADSEPG